MKQDKEEVLRLNQLAFLGRLLSGFTHELKNHLAIIKESSGLMNDLVELGRLKDEETSGKFQKIIGSIAERIDIANNLIKNLNSFGHRMDNPESVFNPNTLVLEEMALLKKFVRLKGVEVQLDLQDDIASVQSRPALLHFLLYLLVDGVLKEADKGDLIRLATSNANGKVALELDARATRYSKSGITDPAIEDLLRYIASKLKIGLEQESEVPWTHCRLLLPAS